MEIPSNDTKACKCGKAVKASDNFCAGCGHHFRAIRSENEIKAECEFVKNFDSKELTLTMAQMNFYLALEWVLGDKTSPREFLEGCAKKMAEREKKPA